MTPQQPVGPRSQRLGANSSPEHCREKWDETAEFIFTPSRLPGRGFFVPLNPNLSQWKQNNEQECRIHEGIEVP